jgi:transcriptional regulator with XRE-family HTH domain
VADEEPTPLGEFIRRQRELQDTSMREFARMAGISNPYLSQIERGLRAPSDQVVKAIADALQVSADTLHAHAESDDDTDSDEPSAVLAAIADDPRLTARQRQALSEVYRGLVASNPPRSGRKGR